MRRFKLIGNTFPSYMNGKTFTVDRVTKSDYYLPDFNVKLNFVKGWEVEEVHLFNEYLKLIKQ